MNNKHKSDQSLILLLLKESFFYVSKIYALFISDSGDIRIFFSIVRVTPGGVGQAGADALGDGGLDGHEGAKAGSVSLAGNDTRQG